MLNKSALILLALSLGFQMLAGCSQTQLIAHTAKRIAKSESTNTIGKYKVGDPYKIKGIWYYPRVDYRYDKTGIASWYGPGFHGKKTANGEVYDQNALTAAHKTLPMPSMVQVTNLENGRSLRLTINDRGPFAHGRIIDVSRRGAQLLGFFKDGTARVRVQLMETESRILAQQAKQNILFQSGGTPIGSQTKLPKASVTQKSLLPPKGGTESKPKNILVSKKPSIRASKSISTKRSRMPIADGKITQVPIVENEMYIQVGAFTEFNNANRVAMRLAGLENVKITSKIIGSKEFFRVRAGPISSLSNADNILDRVLNAGFLAARIVVD